VKNASLLTDGFYTYHLAAVNSKHEVVSKEDIQDHNGKLIAPKGARIDYYFSERIAQRKLLKPLDQLIELSEKLDASTLKYHFEQLFEKYFDLRQIHGRHNFAETLRHLIDEIPHNAMLNQQLTVLHIRLPEVYERSLFCAWMSALVAQNCDLSDQQIKSIFVAGLYHKLGLLHVNPNIIYKKKHLQQDEWHIIKSYVAISYLFFTESLIDLPDAARAILEHHECCDGTGYPQGLKESKLSQIGQILALADKLYSVRMIQFKDTKNTLYDTLPFLHLNSQQHTLFIYSKFCITLLKARLTDNTDILLNEYEHCIETTIEHSSFLHDTVVMLEFVREYTESSDVSYDGANLVSYIDPILQLINRSGLIREKVFYKLRMQRLKLLSSEMKNLCETKRMQIELFYQINKMFHMIADYLGTDERINDHLRAQFERLERYIHNTLPVDNLL